jgi:hypothetical protein
MSSYIMTVTTLTMVAARHRRTRPIRLLMKMRPTRPTRMTRPMRTVSHIVADRLLVVKRKRKSKGRKRGGRTLPIMMTLQWTTMTRRRTTATISTMVPSNQGYKAMLTAILSLLMAHGNDGKRTKGNKTG